MLICNKIKAPIVPYMDQLLQQCEQKQTASSLRFEQALFLGDGQALDTRTRNKTRQALLAVSLWLL